MDSRIIVNAILGNADRLVSRLVMDNPGVANLECPVPYIEPSARSVPGSLPMSAESAVSSEGNFVYPIHYALLKVVENGRFLDNLSAPGSDGEEEFQKSRRIVATLLRAGCSLRRSPCSLVLSTWSGCLVPAECCDPIQFLSFLKWLSGLRPTGMRAVGEVIDVLVDAEWDAHHSQQIGVRQRETHDDNRAGDLLRAMDIHYDVEITFGDGQPSLQAHLAVLSVASPYLASLVRWPTTPSLREDGADHNTLKISFETNTDRRVWQYILNFIYCRPLPVTLFQDGPVSSFYDVDVWTLLGVVEFAHEACMSSLAESAEGALRRLFTTDAPLKKFNLNSDSSIILGTLRACVRLELKNLSPTVQRFVHKHIDKLVHNEPLRHFLFLHPQLLAQKK